MWIFNSISLDCWDEDVPSRGCHQRPRLAGEQKKHLTSQGQTWSS